ncbi:cytochrome P450 [Ilyonectria destructans]|nr:cytochrome P450 [Ilyonectria destructans]
MPAALTAQIILYTISSVCYNILFHPLRNFPGPFWMRATRMTYCYKLMGGSLPFEMLDIHKKYGTVVRIAPNELAFGDPNAWNEIMGHRVGAKKGAEFEKSTAFYRPMGGPSDIVNSGGDEHATLRRLMSHGFSSRSLKEQEPLIMKYVDLLTQRLHQNCDKTVDIMSWYNYTTFDLIGDLAFGEPFGCLNNSDYHPWVKTIFQMARLGTVFQTASYFPLLRSLIIRVLSTKKIRARKLQHATMTKEKLLRRMELGKARGRPDLIDNLLRKKDELGMTMDQVVKNAGVLIIAGSETTATVLSGVTYLLLKNPKALSKLTEEVRTTFQSEEEIDLTSVNKLSYMLACLDEALRMYPPIAGGLSRVCPEGGATVSGRFIPENTIVAIHQWAMYHNENHWSDPMEFRPERFIDSAAYQKDRRDSLQPFHLGPRNCLGRK